MGEKRTACMVLLGKPVRERPLEAATCQMEGNIKVDLPERGCDGVDWINVARDRNRWQTVVYAVMKLRLPQNADNFLVR